MIEIIASDVADNYGNNYQANLVLDDVVRDNPTTSVEGLVFWRYADEPDAEPQLLGAATVGVNFNIPFDFSDGREIELFAVAKTATGEQSAVNPLNGETERFLPNLETNVPGIAQTPGTTATNTSANVTVSNFTFRALHRRISVSPNSDMSGATTTFQSAVDFGGNLPNTIDITKAASAGSEHRYVTVEHSSNDSEWGAVSNVLDLIFADSGGSGGGGGQTRAIITSALWSAPSDVDLDWSAASGSGNYTIQFRRREQYYNPTKDIWQYLSWNNYSFGTVTSTEAASPYTDSQGYATDYGAEVQVQYRIKRTSQDDSLYSDVVTVDIPAEP